MNINCYSKNIAYNNVVLILVSVFIFAEFTIITLALKYELLIPVILGSIIVVIFLLQNLFWGLCSVILSFLYIYVKAESEGIDFIEIIFGFYFILFLAVWFLRRVIIEKKKFIKDWTDIALILFITSTVFSLALAFVGGNNMLKAIRELIPLLTYLLYFPIIDLTDTDKRLKVLIACFICFFSLVALRNYYFYIKALSSVTALWELTILSRQTSGEVFFLIMVILSLSVLIYTKSFRMKLLSIIGLIFFGVMDILTYTRGIWIATAVSLFSLFFLVGKKQKTTIVIAIVLIVISTIIFATKSEGLIHSAFLVVTERFMTLSPGKILMDLSLQDKILEAKVLINKISKNPIAGYGLGSTFSFYTPLRGYLRDYWYSHNFYLFIWFKLGILGLMSFLILFIGTIITGKKCKGTSISNEYYALVLGSVASMIGLLVGSMTLPDLFSKGSILGAVFIFVVVKIISRKKKRMIDGPKYETQAF